jgi:hypothetical protein
MKNQVGCRCDTAAVDQGLEEAFESLLAGYVGQAPRPVLFCPESGRHPLAMVFDSVFRLPVLGLLSLNEVWYQYNNGDES